MTSMTIYDDPSSTTFRLWRPMTTQNGEWHIMKTHDIVLSFVSQNYFYDDWDDWCRPLTTQDDPLLDKTLALMHMYVTREIRDASVQMEFAKLKQISQLYSEANMRLSGKKK